MANEDRIDGLASTLGMKAPVKAVAASNITLSGEQTIDGQSCLEENAAGRPDRVLAANQTDASENGIYDVQTGAWVRAKDMDGQRDIVDGTVVPVAKGTTYGNSLWQANLTDPATFDTTEITFTQIV